MALRTSRSMQAKNAARVLPEPVGAEISVLRPETMWGHPSSWGSVGVPKQRTNQSRTSGCAQAKAGESGSMAYFKMKVHFRQMFAARFALCVVKSLHVASPRQKNQVAVV